MREVLQVNMAFSSFPLSTLITLLLLVASIQSNSMYGKKVFIFFFLLTLLYLFCSVNTTDSLSFLYTCGIQGSSHSFCTSQGISAHTVTQISLQRLSYLSVIVTLCLFFYSTYRLLQTNKSYHSALMTILNFFHLFFVIISLLVTIIGSSNHLDS